MSDVVHLRHHESTYSWCSRAIHSTTDVAATTCLACLLACAEYGSEARHRYEVLREAGAVES